MVLTDCVDPWIPSLHGSNACEGALETSRFAIDGEVPAPTAVGEQEQADGAMSDR